MLWRPFCSERIVSSIYPTGPVAVGRRPLDYNVCARVNDNRAPFRARGPLLGRLLASIFASLNLSYPKFSALLAYLGSIFQIFTIFSYLLAPKY